MRCDGLLTTAGDVPGLWRQMTAQREQKLFLRRFFLPSPRGWRVYMELLGLGIWIGIGIGLWLALMMATWRRLK